MRLYHSASNSFINLHILSYAKLLVCPALPMWWQFWISDPQKTLNSM
jgi:hypothetical protein